MCIIRKRSLGPLATDSVSQLNVLGHDVMTLLVWMAHRLVSYSESECNDTSADCGGNSGVYHPVSVWMRIIMSPKVYH